VINIPTNKADHTGILVFVFTATTQTRQVRSSTEGTLEWVPWEQLSTKDLVEDLPTLLPHVLTMEKDKPPFFAHYRYDAQDHLIITFA
jgi:hypothetical protein